MSLKSHICVNGDFPGQQERSPIGGGGGGGLKIGSPPGWGGGVIEGFSEQKHNNYRKESSASFSTAAEEWRSANNGELSFFGVGGITTAHARWAPPPPPRGDDVRARRLSRGSARERGKVLGARGFSCPPLSPWQPVLTGNTRLIYEGWAGGSEPQRSRARTGCASSPGQKQETERSKTEIKSPLKITERTL